MSLVWNDTDMTSKESKANGGYKDNLDGQLTNRLPPDVWILGVGPSSDSSSYKERLKQNVRHVDLWICGLPETDHGTLSHCNVLHLEVVH